MGGEERRPGGTDLAFELRTEGLPNPWKPGRALPNPFAGVVNNPDDPTTIPIVRSGSDGKGWASSRDVAAFFGKRHDNVLRDIEALMAEAPACALNFEGTSEAVAMPRGGVRQERAFLMNRDGFTLLAMGFTGKKALKFKLDYIAAYTALEAEAIEARKREARAQRIADAVAMAKATGLYGDHTDARLSDVVHRLLPGTFGNEPT